MAPALAAGEERRFPALAHASARRDQVAARRVQPPLQARRVRRPSSNGPTSTATWRQSPATQKRKESPPEYPWPITEPRSGATPTAHDIRTGKISCWSIAHSGRELFGLVRPVGTFPDRSPEPACAHTLHENPFRPAALLARMKSSSCWAVQKPGHVRLPSEHFIPPAGQPLRACASTRSILRQGSFATSPARVVPRTAARPARIRPCPLNWNGTRRAGAGTSPLSDAKVCMPCIRPRWAPGQTQFACLPPRCPPF